MLETLIFSQIAQVSESYHDGYRDHVSRSNENMKGGDTHQ